MAGGMRHPAGVDRVDLEPHHRQAEPAGCFYACPHQRRADALPVNGCGTRRQLTRALVGGQLRGPHHVLFAIGGNKHVAGRITERAFELLAIHELEYQGCVDLGQMTGTGERSRGSVGPQPDDRVNVIGRGLTYAP